MRTLVGCGLLGIGIAGSNYLGMWAIEILGRIAWSADLMLASFSAWLR